MSRSSGGSGSPPEFSPVGERGRRGRQRRRKEEEVNREE